MKKSRLLILILFVVASGIFVLGYRQSRRSDSAKVFKEPSRIASLAPNITEILFGLGLDESIVAVSSDSDHPAGAGNKPKLGTFWQPNMEAVIAAKPDLVIALWFEQQKRLAKRLGELGYEAIVLKITNTDELFAAIERIGEVTGRELEAKILSEGLRKKLTEIEISSASREKVKVLWVVQTEPLRVAGRDTFINELIEICGGENAIGPTIQPYPPIGSEQVIGCGAKVIIQPAMGEVNIAEQQERAEKFWSKWPNLPAVKNNCIYVVEADTVCRLGPRLDEAVRIINECLHPENVKAGVGKQ